tara:strand:+ start:237 stop:365 length:129 start_codon:yes stop_codon:yes gene_type:complete
MVFSLNIKYKKGTTKTPIREFYDPYGFKKKGQLNGIKVKFKN